MNKRQKKKKITQMGARFIELSKIYEELKVLGTFSINGFGSYRGNTVCLIQPRDMVKLPFFDRDKLFIKKDGGVYPFSANIDFAMITFKAILDDDELLEYFPEHVKKEAEYIEIDGVRYLKEV